MKRLEIHLTKKQIYQIREYASKNGYPENCGLQGKHFYLITQPVVKDWEDRLDVVLLNERQGKKLQKVLVEMNDEAR